MDSIILVLGYVGILLMLSGYFMLLSGHIKVTDTSHILLNVLGSMFIVIALYSGVVLPLLYVVVLWLLISVFGWFKHSSVSS